MVFVTVHPVVCNNTFVLAVIIYYIQYCTMTRIEKRTRKQHTPPKRGVHPLMLPKYNLFELFLARFLLTNRSRQCWDILTLKNFSNLLVPDYILCCGISLDTFTETRCLFQTIQLLHNTLFFLDQTLYSAVLFVFVILLLFWCFISLW